MEKLLKLINEHQKEIFGENYLEVVAFRDGIFWSNSDCTISVMDYIHLVSKSYGFIKWLVDNDKIERKTFGESDTKCGKYIDQELSYNTSVEDYTNILLFELAIQENPIEFLVSILK